MYKLFFKIPRKRLNEMNEVNVMRLEQFSYKNLKENCDTQGMKK